MHEAVGGLRPRPAELNTVFNDAGYQQVGRSVDSSAKPSVGVVASIARAVKHCAKNPKKQVFLMFWDVS